MKITELRLMRGPNYWSVKHPKIVVMKLAFEEFKGKTTLDFPQLPDQLVSLMPDLKNHRAGEKKPGGFIKKVKKGTSLAKVVQHVALELQTMAGMSCGFGRTTETKEPGVEQVIFSYLVEPAGDYAARAAVRLVKELCRGKDYANRLTLDNGRLHQIREEAYFGPSTESIITEAKNRNIPYIRLNEHSLVQFGYGVHQQRIESTITSKTSFSAVQIAGDKNATKKILDEAGIPVPKGTIVYDQEELKEAIEKLGYPIVLKPLDGHQGKGASINIQTWKEALKGLDEAKYYSNAVMIEQFITGDDYRMLVVNGKFVAAAKRTPASITGNGKATIKELIQEVNKDPRRGIGHEKELTNIKVDKFTKAILKEKNLTLNTVLPDGEILYLKYTANLSTGGTATDVTDLVDPFNVIMAERIAGIIGLDVCGIDVMTTDIAIPLPETRGAVIEVNAAPGFRMHIAPTYGLPRNVAEPVVSMLFPANCPFRIPIVAVTGTNGKTTTTRLLAHMVKIRGFKVGFTTTDGIYIQDKLVLEGDTTGSFSAEFVLRDPTVNFAVLETARGGMLRTGLGFDKCDIGIVTNVAADHLGLRDINSIEEMASVKSVVPKTVHKDGYAVLNADDDLVYRMQEDLDCNIALFSLDENNSRIKKHIESGGLAAVYENGFITVFKNSYKIRIENVAAIPVTFEGRAKFNIANALAATLACYISGFDKDEIRLGLNTFLPSPEKTPGRMNLFKLPEFEVLIDYAHNAAGLTAYGEFLNEVKATPKIGIIAGVGDRRDEDTIAFGRIAASLFDEIIIRQDKDLRGKSSADIFNLIREGIQSVSDNKQVIEITDEMEAITYALKNAPKGSFVTIFSNEIPEAIKLVKTYMHQVQNKVLAEELPGKKLRSKP